ncbi:amidohydrolase [Oceanimonas marisflavi]|uniref:amidohydrolase n=1 Tax=Oceanimonas marisflavi TaxID=2059724 RepID=UPI000D309D82|nr:amidohydrolase [Oceanimonas marisflavi]
MKNVMRKLARLTLAMAPLMAYGAAAGNPDGVADAIYHSAKVITVNESFDIAEAVALKNGRIMAVGSNSDIQALASADTKQVDLQGKTLLPGFYDGHIHLGTGVRPFGATFNVPAPNQLNRILTEQAANTPAGEWLVGVMNRPYCHMAMPNRWELDAIVPDHPVMLACGVLKLTLNSQAIKLAGLSKETPDPKDGLIVRDEQGEPLGVLTMGARRYALGVIPKSALHDDSARENLRAQLKKFPPMGVTSVNVAGVRPHELRLIQDVYARWGEELPRATLQVFLFPGYDNVEASLAEIEGLGFHTGVGNDRLKLGAIKMAMDGAIAVPDFRTLKPYDSKVRFDERGPWENQKGDFNGVTVIPEDSLYRVSKRAHELGWQLGIHTIGDAAVVQAVEVLERILKESPREDHRHHLHHLTIRPPEKTLAKIAELDIIVDTQPNYTYYNNAFMLAAVSGNRLERQNPQRSLLDHGIKIAYGSDGLPHGPLLGIWAATTRMGYDGKVYGAEEAIKVEEAIRAYTQGPAYLTFDEHERGSIEVGKVADMVVLAEDPLAVDPLHLRDVAVEKTVVAGKELFAGSHIEPYHQTAPTP